MHKQSFDFIEPTLAIMQSLAHNIYHHSLKFIIFPKCQKNIHNRQVRENGDCFFFCFVFFYFKWWHNILSIPQIIFSKNKIFYFYCVHRPRTMNTMKVQQYISHECQSQPKGRWRPIAGSENHPFDLFIKCQKLISFKRQNILSDGFLSGF